MNHQNVSESARPSTLIEFADDFVAAHLEELREKAVSKPNYPWQARAPIPPGLEGPFHRVDRALILAKHHPEPQEAGMVNLEVRMFVEKSPESKFLVLDVCYWG